MLAALLNFLVWLVVMPPLHPFDEAQHFLYAHDLARAPQLRWGFDTQAPQELMELAEWTSLKTPPLQRRSPFEGETCWRRLEMLGEQGGGGLQPDPYLRCLTHAPFRHYQPPLYYWLCAPAHWLLAGQSIVFRLLAQRLISVALGLVGVWLAYRIGRRIWPEQDCLAWSLAGALAFQPNYAFFSAVANNELLEVVLAELVLLCTLNTLQTGASPAKARIGGLLLALGLLTRLTFLAVWAATLLCLGRCPRRHWIYLALIPAALALWWYLPLLSGGEANALSSYYVEGDFNPGYSAPLWTPWNYLGQFRWSRWLWLGLGYWVGPFSFDFDWWPRGAAQWSVLCLAAGTFALLLLALFHKLRRRLLTPEWRALAWPSLFLLAFLQSLDYLLVRGAGEGFFIIRSQYLLPGLAGQLAWLLAGLQCLKRTPAWAPLLVLASMWINLQALLRTLDSGWGAGPLQDQLGVAGALWWLPAGSLASLWLAQSLLSLLLLTGLLIGIKRTK